MKWVPLHVHSDSSLQDGLSLTSQIAARCSLLGYEACALTDHGTVSGIPSLVREFEAIEKKTKKKLKPILGMEAYLCKESAKIRTKENGPLKHLCVLAKNKAGWQGLMRAVSASNHPDHFYRKPRLSLEELAAFAEGNWIVFSGHPGSEVGDLLWRDHRAAYKARTIDQAGEWLAPENASAVIERIALYQRLFGKENFYLEIQLIDRVNLPAVDLIALALRKIGQEWNIPCVATADSHYPTQEDAPDQRVLLCNSMKLTMKEIASRLAEQEDIGLGGFFKSNRYHIPTLEEMQELHPEHELQASVEIANRCESYKIFGPPRFPVFDCPDQRTPDQHLRQLCRDGWKQKIQPLIPKDKQPPYVERIQHELEIIAENNLSAYFLVVEDYIRWAVNQGMMPGIGRGSSAGCLISYLINITDADPLEYDLLFERFISIGRLAPAHLSLDECPYLDWESPKGEAEDLFVGAMSGRLAEAEKSPHFQEEKNLLKIRRVKHYYRHLIHSVKVDKSNPKNSYILWVMGKVNTVDLDKPAAITPARVALPDIDTDFPKSRRDEVIEYLRQKYGPDKVSHMITYGRTQGRSALKTVLRVHDSVTPEEMNRITKFIPDKARISDELEIMRQLGETPSILKWSLEHNAKELSEWCVMKEDGTLEGLLAKEFEQAIRLEKVAVNQGVHASGIIISTEPLADVLPMVRCKNSDHLIPAFEMNDLEAMGFIKFDILGIKPLDCLTTVQHLLRTGRFPKRGEKLDTDQELGVTAEEEG